MLTVTMVKVIVLFHVFIQISNVFSEFCVLHELVTIDHPVCEQQECSNSTRYKRNAYNDYQPYLHNRLPEVQEGSPSAEHFESVDDNDNDNYSYNVRFTFEEVDTVVIACDDSKYRSIDGSCNNLENPNWGKSNTPTMRIVQARYNDFPVGGIPNSVSGQPLPLPRVISTTLFPDLDRPSNNLTLAMMQWGQLIAHDSVLSPSAIQFNIDCCAVGVGDLDICCPIQIPENDKFYGQYNVTCMNMIRTRFVYDTSYDCKPVTNQINAATHYLDLSHLYGSTSSVVDSLRQFEGGKLEIHLSGNDRVFPKLSDNPVEDCSFPKSSENMTCFHSGDKRVNQNTQVTCLQTVLLREHNRIATELGILNANWTDEQLFQEARNILIAIYNHISYNEWLPYILGDAYMDKHNLRPQKTGYTEYNKDINAATFNSFSIIYRIFHSQIQGELKMYNQTKCPFKNVKTDRGRCPFKNINISDYMDRPGIITEDNYYDNFLLGLTTQPMQDTDRYFTTQMTEMMFHGDLPYGEDLESFDIQRSRDHGIPTYNIFRELCGLKVAKNFSDLANEMSEKNIALLESVYEDVNDIDVFVALLLEETVAGTSTGPTALCLLGEQFVRKKLGDRYWYEVGGQNHSFTEDQLQEIRKSSFSRLICDNSNNITTIQPDSFLFASDHGNAIVSCDEIPCVNLSKWQE